MPNTAITASPMNFSTVPRGARAPAHRVKYRAMTLRSDSGSSCSPSSVEPVTSQNTIVTVFRTSAAAWERGKCSPQSEQNFAPAAFSAPQLEHAATAESRP